MKRISACALALLLAATGSAFAASSSHDTAPARDGTATMHRLGADLRAGLHKMGNATRHAWHRATGALHRDRGSAGDHGA